MSSKTLITAGYTISREDVTRAAGRRMKSFFALFAGLAITMTGLDAHAGCLDGTVGGCKLTNGCPGERECNSGIWGMCEPVAGTRACSVCGGTGSQQCNGAGQIVSACVRPEVCGNTCDDDGDVLVDEGCPSPSTSVTVRLDPFITSPQSVEHGFKLDEEFGDYDLGDDIWPDFKYFGYPMSGVPLEGNIYEYRLSSGYDMLMCTNPFYGGTCFSASSASSPVGQWVKAPTNGYYAGSIEITKTSWAQFPRYTERPPYPFEVEVEWSYRGQGLTHLGKDWYFTSVENEDEDANSIFKVPVSADLALAGQYTAMAKMPTGQGWEGCHHFGDPDALGDEIVVPVQGCTAGRRFVTYNASLSVMGWKTIRPTDPGGSEDIAAWVALNPHNGLAYTGRYNDCDRIYVYKIHDTKEPEFADYAYTIQLDRALDAVQGGDISDTGHLYLASNGSTWDQVTHGIYVFRVTGRSAELQRTIGFHKLYSEVFGFDNGDEVEGIDLWDLSQVSGKHASLDEAGEVHLMVMDLDAGADDFTLKHFAADDPAKL